MRLSTLSFAAVLAILSGSALASPVVNSDIVATRIFNDTPGSSLVVTNTYPTIVQFAETGVTNGVNRHNFRLSSDSGASATQFNNNDAFSIFSDVTISGTGNAEAGLNVHPWWDPQVSGAFIIKSNGEVAAFDGRLPFWSFGFIYTPGTTVRLGISYEPNGLSSSSPAQIQYSYFDGATTRYSPFLNFDEGNPAEAAVHGSWGDLTSTYVGGYVQHNGDTTATFGNIVYAPAPGAASLLALGGLVAKRRRR